MILYSICCSIYGGVDRPCDIIVSSLSPANILVTILPYFYIPGAQLLTTERALECIRSSERNIEGPLLTKALDLVIGKAMRTLYSALCTKKTIRIYQMIKYEFIFFLSHMVIILKDNARCHVEFMS